MVERNQDPSPEKPQQPDKPGLIQRVKGGHFNPKSPPKEASPIPIDLSVESESESEEKVQCVHHWMVGPQIGGVSSGSCRKCGETREFRAEPDRWSELPPSSNPITSKEKSRLQLDE